MMEKCRYDETWHGFCSLSLSLSLINKCIVEFHATLQKIQNFTYLRSHRVPGGMSVETPVFVPLNRGNNVQIYN